MELDVQARVISGRSNPDAIGEAADLLKLIANPNRLAILRRLAEGEVSVGEMEEKLGIRQPTLSQQLAELRRSGLIHDRREAKVVFYRLTSEHARAIVDHICDLFCGPRPVSAKSSLRSERDHKVEPEPNSHAAVFARILDQKESLALN